MSRNTRNFIAAVALVAVAGTAAPTHGGHDTGIVADIVAITLAPGIADLMERRFPRGCKTCTDCRGRSQHKAERGSSHQSSGAHTPRLHAASPWQDKRQQSCSRTARAWTRSSRPGSCGLEGKYPDGHLCDGWSGQVVRLGPPAGPRRGVGLELKGARVGALSGPVYSE